MSSWTRSFGYFLLPLIIGGLLASYYWLAVYPNAEPSPEHLAQIVERGRLVAGIRALPTTYYRADDKVHGMEYELMNHLADQLGVKLEVRVAQNNQQLYQMLLEGEVDLIATGTPVTELSKSLTRYSPIYLYVQEQIVYNKTKQKAIADLGTLEQPLSVLSITPHLETLTRLQQTYPKLLFKFEPDIDYESVLARVNNGEIAYALIYSHEMSLLRARYPNLGIAYTLPDERGLALYVKRMDDTSLLEQMQHFFLKIQGDGTLAQLRDRYYGHMSTFTPQQARLFQRRIKSHLPRYESIFREAAARYELDWCLLATVSHQESLWNKSAVSGTGVRGLMMLTQNTAKQVGVVNRVDPRQSIMGGARYLLYLYQRLPEEIAEPDRTWFALAAYNVGYGHVKDVFHLARKDGKDPYVWSSVRPYFYLLSKSEWYKDLEYGYARGYETVDYVQRIRSYYALLKQYYDTQVEQTASQVSYAHSDYQQNCH